MENIIRSLKQKPRIIDIAVGLILVVGLAALSKMRSNFLPPEPTNFVAVNVTYRGASPQEVEEEVVDKIEDLLDGLKGVDRITSSAQESFANIRIELLEEAILMKCYRMSAPLLIRFQPSPTGSMRQSYSRRKS